MTRGDATRHVTVWYGRVWESGSDDNPSCEVHQIVFPTGFARSSQSVRQPRFSQGQMNTGATDTTSSHIIPWALAVSTALHQSCPTCVAQQAAAQVGDATWFPKVK